MSRIPVANFVACVEQIANEGPAYRKGQDGSNGYCDCIGLVIGGIRRAGGQWRGLHGSNYAARKEIAQLRAIGSTGELAVGEAVFKAYEPGQGGYDLPDRYTHGSEYANGDLRDYYHVGVVESVSPLRIRHMTTPKPKMDTSLGKWAWHGKLKKIDYTAKEQGNVMTATVVLPAGSKGATVNLRAHENTHSEVLFRVPVGSVVDVLQDLGQWCEIEYNGITGYMMSNYIEYPGQGEEISGDVLTADERQKIDNALLDIENRIELIRSTLGRG